MTPRTKQHTRKLLDEVKEIRGPGAELSDWCVRAQALLMVAACENLVTEEAPNEQDEDRMV